MIYKNILEKIGKTPMVEINKINDSEAVIYGKLESFNPGGSVKDRIAKNMIEAAEKDGSLKKDSVIIEPTSGNTGIGLAMVSAVKGYKLILIMPDTMSKERRAILKAYGAELVLTPGTGGMKATIDKAQELAKEYENAFIPQQFQNPANPDVHRKTTALEIIEDTDGEVDIFIAGIGTGGTITGVGQELKKRIDGVEIVAVEPEGSAVLSGENPGPHKIQGIGAGFVPEILDTNAYDRIEKIENDQSFEMMRRLAKEEGVLAGISSGAAMAVALRLAKKPENKGKKIVVLLPDTGERYLSMDIFK
ncbi:MAG: cysteine synthase A [Fusobacteriota bacterium]